MNKTKKKRHVLQTGYVSIGQDEAATVHNENGGQLRLNWPNGYNEKEPIDIQNKRCRLIIEEA